MEIVESLITFLHVVVSLIIIIAVLLQPGKSGDLGSMFGGGTSESIFGSSGAVPFLAKLTRILGVVFFATSLSLGYFAISDNSSSVLKGVDASTAGFEALTDPEEETAGTSAEDGQPQMENMENTDQPEAEQATEDAPASEKLEEKSEQNETDKQSE